MAVLFPVTWTINSNLNSLLSGKTGAFADKMFAYLRVDQSQSGAIDDMLYAFLGGLGYTGTIEERMNAWESADFAVAGGGADALLLETGDNFLLETGDNLLLE